MWRQASVIDCKSTEQKGVPLMSALVSVSRVGIVVAARVMLLVVMVMSSSLRAVRSVRARAVVMVMVTSAGVMGAGMLNMLLVVMMVMHDRVLLLLLLNSMGSRDDRGADGEFRDQDGGSREGRSFLGA